MADYIRVPIPVEPSDVEQEMIADLKARIPGWQENDLNLDTAEMQVGALQIAVVREVASSVLDTIYRTAGASLYGVLPNDATAATGDSTWVMPDTAGYTIPAGIEVSKAVAGDQATGFRTTLEVIVPPGSSTTAAGEVPLEALVAGAAGTGLSGVLDLITPLDFNGGTPTITLVGSTVGGQDAEDDPAYLDRLTRKLRRLSFGIVLPADVAEAAQEVAGVDRVLVIDNFIPGVNEKQSISHAGTGGTLPITWSGQTTSQIAWNASAATAQAALEALSNIAPGEIVVTGTTLNAGLTVEFIGAKGQADQPAMTASNASLTPTSSAITITTTQAGVAAQTNAAAALTVVPIDAAGGNVPDVVKTAISTALAAGREQGFVFSTMDAIRTSIAVTFSATALPGFTAASVKAAAEAAVTAYLSPANWGQPVGGDQRAWVEDTTVRFGELYAVLNAVPGLDHVLTLTITPPGTANTNTTLAGPGALPALTSCVGTVS